MFVKSKTKSSSSLGLKKLILHKIFSILNYRQPLVQSVLHNTVVKTNAATKLGSLFQPKPTDFSSKNTSANSITHHAQHSQTV